MMDDRIQLTVAAVDIAAAIDRLEGFRVLRRVEPLVRRIGKPVKDVFLHGVALKAIAKEEDRTAACEMAMLRFIAHRNGAIVDVGPVARWSVEPQPADPATTIPSAGAACGRTMGEAEATSMLLDADFVVAHDAGVDRPLVDRRLPLAAGRPWVCSMHDVPWMRHGFERGALPWLLAQIGLFRDAQDVGTDVVSLVHLLDHRLEEPGVTVLGAALVMAGERNWLVKAADVSSDCRSLLEDRGYRWTRWGGHWLREVPEAGLAGEIAWMTEHVHRNGSKPSFGKVDWRNRYAAW